MISVSFNVYSFYDKPTFQKPLNETHQVVLKLTMYSMMNQLEPSMLKNLEYQLQLA